MKLDRIAFPVLDLLEAVREDVAAHARGGGVSIEVDRTSGAFESVFDALKIKQALVNLARNAVEASAPGNRVVLLASRQGGRLILMSWTKARASRPGCARRSSSRS